MSGASNGTLARLGARLQILHQEKVGPWVPTSWTSRHAPTVTQVAASLLILASPWVSTGMNAVLVVALAACGAVWWLARPGEVFAPSRMAWPVGLFFATLAIAAAGSPYLTASLKGLAKFAVYGLAYLTFRRLMAHHPATRIVLASAFVLAALGEAAYGLYQFKIKVAPLATWEDAESGLNLTRVYGSLRNPNLMGAYLAIAWPAAWALAFASRGPSRWLGALALPLIPACVYVTYSRGAWLALAAEVAVLGGAWLLAGRRRGRLSRGVQMSLVLLGLAGLAVAAWHLAPTLQARVASMLNVTGDSSNVFRTQVWRATVALIRDSWWLGVGIGNDAFRHAYALYMISGFEALGAYNIFLEWWAEAGLPGLVAFVGLLVTVIRVPRWTADDWPWAAAVTAAVAGLCLHGLVDTVFFRPAVQLGFWWWVAVSATWPPVTAEDRA
ncbi:MAG: O-antigen ligase family protein [Candidatus Sericytochromatia bacterium]|nr:O-antigen ligase family protein [Candidatus Sericytochromatia bacterium]